MKRFYYFILIIFTWIVTVSFICCSSPNADNEENLAIIDEETAGDTEGGFAMVTAVSSSGNINNYTFSVTISSPDTGCNQYADWWEVIDLDGNLLYRRILGHSHVNEQPFTRSGGTVPIQSTTEVYVRAHMNNIGYGSSALRGSVENGFQTINLDVDFASGLATEEPLPNGCAF